MTQMAMVDVSANNHPQGLPIQWTRVKAAGYGAVMVKATEGTSYVNPWLERDATLARAAGLLVGFYHFAHPSQSDPGVQAAYAVQETAGLGHELGLALDLEVAEGLSWGALATWARDFHGEVRKAYDHAPLYCDDAFLASLPGAPWGERLWLAQTARPRREVWAWQATTPLTVPGIDAPTDVGWLHPDAA